MLSFKKEKMKFHYKKEYQPNQNKNKETLKQKIYSKILNLKSINKSSLNNIGLKINTNASEILKQTKFDVN